MIFFDFVQGLSYFVVVRYLQLRHHSVFFCERYVCCFFCHLRCVQTCPVEFLGSLAADNLIKYGVATSTLSHREANASVMTFFRDLIRGPSDTGFDSSILRNLITQVLAKHGQEIMIGMHVQIPRQFFFK